MEGKGISDQNQGANLLEFKNLTHLRFADDVVIIAKSGEELTGMAEELRKASEEMGLSINFSKTKVMPNILALGRLKLMMTKLSVSQNIDI